MLMPFFQYQVVFYTPVKMFNDVGQTLGDKVSQLGFD